MSSNPGMSGVADALRRLRTWVTGCAGLLILALCVQMLVFGFVRFTDARWARLAPEARTQNMRIVQGVGESGGAKREPAARESEAAGRDVNLGFSASEAVFRTAGGLSHWAGTVAVIGLCIMSVLGLLIASAVGGREGLHGLDKTVTACGWAALLAIACAPWGSQTGWLLAGESESGIPSVLWSYEAMAALAENQKNGDIPLTARFVLLPLVGMCCAGLVCWFFREGMARMIFAYTMSADERTSQQEMQQITEQGIGGRLSRTGAAFNSALREPTAEPANPIPMRLAAGDELRGRTDEKRGRDVVDEVLGPIGQARAGNGLRRPI